MNTIVVSTRAPLPRGGYACKLAHSNELFHESIQKVSFQESDIKNILTHQLLGAKNREAAPVSTRCGLKRQRMDALTVFVRPGYCVRVGSFVNRALGLRRKETKPMNRTPNHNWPGKSGCVYTYEVYPIGTSFRDVAGNYIYAKQVGSQWQPCYIGQTNSLQTRIANHEKEACAKRHGATHLHVKVTPSERDSLAEEADLIRLWNPPCNDQHTQG